MSLAITGYIIHQGPELFLSMNVSSEKSVSLWMGTKVLEDAPALDKAEKADVVIVGSGIAGMSVAWELVRAGKDVVILDRGPIGKGMTSRTTAHLTAQCDDGFHQLIGRRGEEIAKAWYQSQAMSIDRIEAHQNELGIKCDFRRLDGHLFHAPGTDIQILAREYEATRAVGMQVFREQGVPFAGQQKTAALRYPDQATFHPLKYLAGLAAAIRKGGGRFYAETTAENVEEAENGVTVTTGGRHAVTAKHAVIATNSPINDRYAIHSKQAPYRTYAMAFSVPRDALPDGLYWDTLEAYHYVRLQPGRGNGDYLIVGGGDHKTGEADDAEARFLALEAWMRNLLPSLGKEKHRWSGQIQDTIDYCGFIGLDPGSKRTYISTGDSGQGITHGSVAGLLISDLIVKGSSPWTEVYDPSRKPVKAAGTFLSENLTVPKNFAEYVAPGERRSWDELKPGEGAIVRSGVTKVAAYRDEKGQLYLRSARCPHLGCHVHWNSFERCWDCPCHGSQFAPDGTALNGPAFSALEEIKP
jgi:glycine/D-amino acid oxidase-like deaminating enzyme/nitrite reductase/ring-hydroxylating ferredoxin subunit